MSSAHANLHHFVLKKFKPIVASKSAQKPSAFTVDINPEHLSALNFFKTHRELLSPFM